VTTDLNLQIADYPNGPVKLQVIKRGTGSIDLEHDQDNPKCARVYAKDPCYPARVFVASDWACF
jgi:hypothetical protein